MRDQSSLTARMFDLACVLVLGLLLTFFAGVIARANPTGTASAHVGPGGAAAAADCDSPAKPDAPVAAAPAKTGESAALSGGLPTSMSIGACADGSGKPAATAPAPAAAAAPAH